MGSNDIEPRMAIVFAHNRHVINVLGPSLSLWSARFCCRIFFRWGLNRSWCQGLLLFKGCWSSGHPGSLSLVSPFVSVICWCAANSPKHQRLKTTTVYMACDLWVSELGKAQLGSCSAGLSWAHLWHLGVDGLTHICDSLLVVSFII